MPCQQEEDPGIGGQTAHTVSQTYPALETVYTLNSHTLQQPINQITSTLQEPVHFKPELKSEQPVGYRKNDNIEEPVTYNTNEEFHDPDDQRISEQSECITENTLQETVCYSNTDENLQPVNYSKNNLLQSDNPEIINLVQNDQPVVIQNLDNLNLQQTETPVDALGHTHQSNSKTLENQSVLREHLIGQLSNQSDKKNKQKDLQKNVNTRKQTADSRTKATVTGKKQVFQYTIRDIEEAPKPCKIVSLSRKLLKLHLKKFYNSVCIDFSSVRLLLSG